MTDAEEVAKGVRASSEWIEMEDGFARLRQAMLEEIVATSPDQLAKRERLYMACQSLDAVKSALKRAAGAGQAASMRMILAEETTLLRP